MKPNRLLCAVVSAFAFACAKGKQQGTLVFLSQPVSTYEGEILAPVVVEVRDSAGKAVSATSVAITLSGAGVAGTLMASTVNGRATFSDLHIDAPTTGAILTASALSVVSSQSSTFDVKPLDLQFDVAPPAQVVVGAVNPIQVSFRNPAGQVVSVSRDVTLSLEPAGGTLSGTTTQTAASGVASFNDVAFQTPGTWTLRATAPNATSVTAMVTVLNSTQPQPPPPPTLAFVAQPVTTYQGEILAPIAVELRDGSGNLVTTTTSITLSAAPVAGTLTVQTVNGRATFSDLHVDAPAQALVLTASGGGAAAVSSTPFDVLALTLRFDVAPPFQVYTGDVNPMQVSFRGPLGEIAPIARAVTLSLTPAGVLAGTTTQTSVSGVASFNDVSVMSAGSFAIDATAANAAGASTLVDAVNRPPTLAFVAQPVTTYQGEILAPVAVELRDGMGTLVSTATAISLSGAPVGGTLTVMTVNGRATFSDLHVDAAAQGLVLTAGGGGAAPVNSTAFDIKALALNFDVAPPLHESPGDVNPIQVSFRGPAGEVAPIARAVTLSLLPSGNLSGTTTRTSVSGVASFNDVAITTPGTYSMQAAAANAAAATTPIDSPYTDTEVEPNDTPQTAQVIRQGYPMTGTLPTGDVDWYRFHATAGQILTASTYAGRFDPTHWNNDIRLRLVAPDGTSELWRTDSSCVGSGAAQVCGFEDTTRIDRGFSGVRIAADGDYYLVVAPHDTVSGRYALLFTLANPPTNLQLESESPNGGGNDTQATAQPIVPGVVSGFFEGGSAGVDYYKISVTAPTRVRLDLNAGRNGAANGAGDYWDTKLNIESAAGGLWTNDDTFFFDSSADYVVTTPGDYYVKLYPCCDSAPSPYLLTYQADAWAPTPESETNLSVGTAMRVAYGQSFGGTFSAKDSRWFAFSGSAGDRVRLRVFDQNNLQGTGAWTTPAFYDATGATKLAAADEGQPYHVIQALLPADGTYTIRVDNGGTTGQFGLMLELIGQTTREVEPNDDLAHATPFPASGQVWGAIGTPGDNDVYSLQATAGQLISVSLFANGGNMNIDYLYSGYGSTLAPRLAIVDAAGNPVVSVGIDQPQPYAESAVRPDPTIEASFVASATGTYYAIVTDVKATSGDPTRFYVLQMLQNQ